MKKLFPEAPDVPQSLANKAVRIVEKHLRTHKVDRARDLPEEAKVRLYRDLRFLFEGESGAGPDGGTKPTRGLLARIWEKIDNFLSMAEANRMCGSTVLISFISFGDQLRPAVICDNDLSQPSA